MSENQSPTTSSHRSPADQHPTAPVGESVGESVGKPTAAQQNPQLNLEGIDTAGVKAEGTAVDSITADPSELEKSDPWETVNLPGTLNLDPLNSLKTDQSGAAKSLPQHRERELLTLIHDLNECNDALLSRLSQLESALENTQAALEAESQKAKAIQSKMAQQVSDEQAVAQQLSQTAQQQVAKLVNQLDIAEQALSRQTLMNENLQTELDNAQERITQLEKECALTSQQHAQEAQARLQAETTNRDLRSRLQRQQRYTLQFKAALEKSLTVSSRPTSTSLSADIAQPISFKEPVPMPKAQRIMPWASGATASFQGIDPHLESLIRGINTPPNEPISTLQKTIDAQKVHHSNGPAPQSSEANDTEAEAQLWQDLERVMTSDSPDDEKESASSVSSSASATTVSPTSSPTSSVSSSSEALSEADGKALDPMPAFSGQAKTKAAAEKSWRNPLRHYRHPLINIMGNIMGNIMSNRNRLLPSWRLTA
ncbi:MAG: hypothetical protein HC800_15805 [Phormidesmis sp. RL_2_1]|nr:hypothetical protein [Phormidesmis sp. RL_2_1]